MILTRVNFALLLQDDFSGSDLINSEFRFIVNQKTVRPLKKPEGYHVFLGLVGEKFTVQIVCTSYSPQIIQVDTQQLDPANPVITVRLYRRLNWHSQDCGWVTGNIKANCPVMILDEKIPNLKLQALEEQEGKTLLLLQSFTVQNLCRQTFCIGNGKLREPFVILQKDARGAYLLDRKLNHSYKSGAQLYRAYRTVADANGDFAIPVPKGEKERLEQMEFYSEKVGKWGSL